MHNYIWIQTEKSLRPQFEPSGSTAGAYPSFNSKKWLEVVLFLPGYDASSSQGYPPPPPSPLALNPQNPPVAIYIHVGGERNCDNQVSCPRTHHNCPDRARTPTARSEDGRTNTRWRVPPYTNWRLSFQTWPKFLFRCHSNLSWAGHRLNRLSVKNN